ncbi:MAG: class I SAM-dependent methyltransferase [Candidatus Dormibacteraceae bacterium]
MDDNLATDWAAHWRCLVEARNAAAMVAGRPTGGQDPAYWDRRARRFERNTSERSDPFLEVVGSFVHPSSTVLDVGAGYGRHAVPLARRADWVTMVEPSAGMRERVPDLPNLTIVASDWMDADVQPASVVLCSHVLYGVLDPVSFIEKLEEAARDRVFLCLRGGRNPHFTERLLPRPRMPQLEDCFNLLRQMGIAPDVRWWAVPVHRHWPDLEAAVDESAEWLGPRWDEARGRPWLEENLRPAPGGGLDYDAAPAPVGALHWRPRRTPS